MRQALFFTMGLNEFINVPIFLRLLLLIQIQIAFI